MDFLTKSVLLLALSGLASFPALANGHIDDARQLFYHEVTDAYRELSSALDNGNFDSAAEAAKKLHERTNNLYDYSSMIEKDVPTLTPNFLDDFRAMQREFGVINSQAGILEVKLGKIPRYALFEVAGLRKAFPGHVRHLPISAPFVDARHASECGRRSTKRG